jgi:hypothetical protein
VTLSILCVTMAEPHARQFVVWMKYLALTIGAEFVLGLDGEVARKSSILSLANTAIDTPAHDVPLQEMVSDLCVNACHGDWILRLDDDECVSPALEKWLASKAYENGTEGTYSFPRVYLYPDASHYLTNPGIYPDLQTRLGRRENMLGVTYIHAGNPHGPGRVLPYAIEHHKLLVKDFDERKRIAARYEAIRSGAGTLPEYARYNLPEMFYPEMEYKDYVNGDFTAR